MGTADGLATGGALDTGPDPTDGGAGMIPGSPGTGARENPEAPRPESPSAPARPDPCDRPQRTLSFLPIITKLCAWAAARSAAVRLDHAARGVLIRDSAQTIVAP